MSRPLETPAYRTPARGETQHTAFATIESPPDCERCPEHPAAPGRYAVLWSSTTTGLLQVCGVCLPGAVEVALADTAPAPVAGRGVRVRVEEWVAPVAVVA